MITASMVKELREKTGAGMMDCKKALADNSGDMEKALAALRQRGLSTAAKKAERVTAEGLVAAYISEDKKAGALVEVNCETDFVSANKEFVDLTGNIARQAAMTDAKCIEDFINEKYILDGSITVRDAVVHLIARLGENISIKRFRKFSVDDGIIIGYIHNEGRIGSLVKICCSSVSTTLEEYGREIAMQIAAVNPSFLGISDIDEHTLKEIRDKFTLEAQSDGKPRNILDRIVSGKLNKYYKEKCLLEQPWIKDEEISMSRYIKEASEKVGAEIKIAGFSRFERGEDTVK